MLVCIVYCFISFKLYRKGKKLHHPNAHGEKEATRILNKKRTASYPKGNKCIHREPNKDPECPALIASFTSRFVKTCSNAAGTRVHKAKHQLHHRGADLHAHDKHMLRKEPQNQDQWGSRAEPQQMHTSVRERVR